MKLKSIIGKVFFSAFHLSLFTLVLLSSCSNIADDERLIYVEPAKAARNVLIEDFTGQRCVNCPKATEAIHAMQEVYGDNVIAVAIHCGPFGFAGNSKNVGLMTDTGKEYWDAWFTSTQGQPVAKINRGEATSAYDNWSNDVARCLEQSTDVSIDVEATCSDGSINIHAVTKANAGRKAKIQAWLVEDGIVAMQSQPDGSINREYTHNHVFRAAVNGTWGEDITYGEVEQTKSWTANVAEGWVAENMQVVVFVYDENGVEQVVKAKVQ